jgi:hypothetical protein
VEDPALPLRNVHESEKFRIIPEVIFGVEPTHIQMGDSPEQNCAKQPKVDRVNSDAEIHDLDRNWGCVTVSV